MAIFSPRQAAFTLDRQQDVQVVTCEHDTLDSNWRGTCANGHEVTRRTAVHVVDESHWCDGTEGWMRHDPHEHVDRSHHECSTCGVTVEVGIIPGGTPQYIPGLVTTTLTGVRPDGAQITASLPPDLFARAMELLNDGVTLAEQAAFVGSIPEQYVYQVTFSR